MITEWTVTGGKINIRYMLEGPPHTRYAVYENYRESCVIIEMGISTLSVGVIFLTRYSNQVLTSVLTC